MDVTKVYFHIYTSPVGSLYIAVNRHGEVLRISMQSEQTWPEGYAAELNKFACGEVEYQLKEYFAGKRQRFDLPLSLIGTPFQLAVWERLQRLPYGSTITYGELALKIGNRRAARAVGGAIARNPVPILVPCHRVLPASGGIGSYALRSLPDGSGTDTKRFLLQLEQALPETV